MPHESSANAARTASKVSSVERPQCDLDAPRARVLGEGFECGTCDLGVRVFAEASKNLWNVHLLGGAGVKQCARRRETGLGLGRDR